MIFICVGSREYQFNRLLKELDYLVEKKHITEEIYAQIGQSSYLPKNFKYERFLSEEKFKNYQSNADLIISHGGTGALIGALKLNKQVIAVPRLAKFGEHIDDHQLQVAGVLAKEGYLSCVLDMKELLENINSMKETVITKKYKKPSQVLNVIENFISEMEVTNRSNKK